MDKAPERIWLDWPAANRGDPVYDEPPERDTQPGQTGYIRADLYTALQARLAEVEAERDAAMQSVAFTATDGQRLLRKVDVADACDSPELCFEDEGLTVRCGPCAVKIASRNGVELNQYTISNPQAMKLRRELTAAEAALATARADALREAAEICGDLAVGYQLHEWSVMALGDAERDILAILNRPADPTPPHRRSPLEHERDEG